ncbi:Wall-associated receptor kinase 1 [Abeliophyllum distichum]|uniref:Wall-associated receptor kinase 1 n=1 Tax=Abeliophyllum distichum TaxID=126358 RepID=A0ABD1RDU4_9LAMI
MACYGNGYDNKTQRSPLVMDFSNSPYTLSDANQVMSIGCDDIVVVQQDAFPLSNTSSIDSCALHCISLQTPVDVGSCPGTGCCLTSISNGNFLLVKPFDTHKYWGRLSHLNHPTAFLETYNQEFMGMPLVLNWKIMGYNCTHSQNSTNYACRKNSYCIDINTTIIFGGYQCRCKKGYDGNPYLGFHD